MDPAKVRVIIDWKASLSAKGLLEFLGFANFDGYFIRNFSRVIAPFYKLKKKDFFFDWFEEACKAF